MAQYIRKRGSVDNNDVDDMQNVDQLPPQE